MSPPFVRAVVKIILPLKKLIERPGLVAGRSCNGVAFNLPKGLIFLCAFPG